MNYRKKLGGWGEEEAVKLLQKKGYEILVKNYHTRYGEIDIIARDHDYLVFVEVKTRKFTEPAEAVDERKQARMLRAAEIYLAAREDQDCEIRFDCITLVKGKNGFQIRHFLDIIEAT